MACQAVSTRWSPTRISPRAGCWRRLTPLGRGLQEVVWPDHGPPHVCYWRAVESEPFFGLPEVPAHDVLELVVINDRGGVERVDVVDGDQARGHVPAVPARRLMLSADVVGRIVVRAEIVDVCLRVAVPH